MAGHRMKAARMERIVGLVLGTAATISVLLLAIGIAGMGAAHVGPLDRPFPAFDVHRLPADLAALEPAGFLWLGLLAVILTPSIRVVASLVGFAVTGERRMVAVAAIVLAVICLSAALAAGG
jgi:uncharacterized membrane protein